MKKIIQPLLIATLTLSGTAILVNCSDDKHSPGGVGVLKESETPLEAQLETTYHSDLKDSFYSMEVKIPNSRGGYDVFVDDEKTNKGLDTKEKGDVYKGLKLKAVKYAGSSKSSEELESLSAVEIAPELNAYVDYTYNTVIAHYYETPDSFLNPNGVNEQINPTLKFFIFREGTYGKTDEGGFERSDYGNHVLFDNSDVSLLAKRFKRSEQEIRQLLIEVYWSADLNIHHTKDLSEEKDFIIAELAKIVAEKNKKEEEKAKKKAEEEAKAAKAAAAIKAKADYAQNGAGSQSQAGEAEAVTTTPVVANGVEVKAEENDQPVAQEGQEKTDEFSIQNGKAQ